MISGSRRMLGMAGGLVFFVGLAGVAFCQVPKYHTTTGTTNGGRSRAPRVTLGEGMVCCDSGDGACDARIQ